MSDQWLTKQTLIMRAQNQEDHSAWDDFVSYYQPFILVILTYSGIKKSDQDDLCQDILIKLWKNLQKFSYNPERGKFRSWLKTIIRNSSIDFYRKKKKINDNEVRSLDNSFDDLETSTQMSEDDLDKIIEKEWRTHVSKLAMERVEKSFSGNAIEVFKLSLEEIPTKEISSRLDIAESSVHKLRKRVEEKLVMEIRRICEEIEF